MLHSDNISNLHLSLWGSPAALAVRAVDSVRGTAAAQHLLNATRQQPTVIVALCEGEAAAVQHLLITSSSRLPVPCGPALWHVLARKFAPASQASGGHSSSLQLSLVLCWDMCLPRRLDRSSSVQTAAIVVLLNSRPSSSSSAAVQKIHLPAQGSKYCCPDAGMSSAGFSCPGTVLD